ncbi:hypothetical protein, partial [Klebsiella aerogenes]|uniref:hypothetical protein n=1 Tax=Klebsiella aerogenes TaxID=548 RepID=UPI001952B7CA
ILVSSIALAMGSGKSDVYSFGVLVLEIISGKKNSSLYQMDDSAAKARVAVSSGVMYLLLLE